MQIDANNALLVAPQALPSIVHEKREAQGLKVIPRFSCELVPISDASCIPRKILRQGLNLTEVQVVAFPCPTN